MCVILLFIRPVCRPLYGWVPSRGRYSGKREIAAFVVFRPNSHSRRRLVPRQWALAAICVGDRRSLALPITGHCRLRTGRLIQHRCLVLSPSAWFAWRAGLRLRSSHVRVLHTTPPDHVLGRTASLAWGSDGPIRRPWCKVPAPEAGMRSGQFEEKGDWRFADHAPVPRTTGARTPGVCAYTGPTVCRTTRLSHILGLSVSRPARWDCRRSSGLRSPATPHGALPGDRP
jgi:hypothetical protein